MSSLRSTRGPSRGTSGSGSATTGSTSGTGSGAGTSSGVSTGATASVTMDVVQFQALLQAVGVPQVPQPAPQPAVVNQTEGPSFALTPGQANANRFIDYTTLTGIKLWQEATAPLPNKFSAKEQDANQFCESLLE